MSDDKNVLARLDRVTGILRNIILIVGGVASALILVWDKVDSPVEAVLYIDDVPGETFYVTSALALDSLASARSRAPEIQRIRKFMSEVGRLDYLVKLRVSNSASTPKGVEIRLKDRRVLSEADKTSADFRKSVFMLARATSSCTAISDSSLQIAPNGLLLPGADGVIAVPRFPPDCTVYLTYAHANAGRGIALEVYVDGRKVDISETHSFSGPLPDYVALAYANGPWSYLLFLVLPLIGVLMLLVALVRKLVRPGPNAPKAAPPTS